jgi:hypothetical protein
VYDFSRSTKSSCRTGSLNKQEEETQIRKKRRSFVKGKFHRVYNKLKQYIQEEEPMSVLQELLVDLEKSYTEAENQTDNYMELLDDDIEHNPGNFYVSCESVFPLLVYSGFPCVEMFRFYHLWPC